MHACFNGSKAEGVMFGWQFIKRAEFVQHSVALGKKSFPVCYSDTTALAMIYIRFIVETSADSNAGIDT